MSTLSAGSTRSYPRVHARLPVSYGEGEPDRRGFAETISEGGLYIKTNDPFKTGTRLVLCLELPDGPVRLSGEVAWAIRVPEHQSEQMMCGMGVSFPRPDPEWRRRFESFRRGAATG